MTAIDTGRWYREMLRDRRLLARTKLLLVVLADAMDVRGYVSVPRSRLAAQLGVVPRRITESVKEAKEAGWIDVVTAGRPGTTAVYVATLPPPIIRDGAPVRPNRRQRDSAYIRTNRADDMGLSTAPSVGADASTKGHAQLGAPIRPPIATSTPQLPGEAQVASAAKRPSNPDTSNISSSSHFPDDQLDSIDVDEWVSLDGKVPLAAPRQLAPSTQVGRS